MNIQKNDISKLVPMSDELISGCREYVKVVHITSIDSDYFFPNITGNPMTNTNVNHNFRHFLWKAGVSHGGRGIGPCIHDYSHTYAVHCLKRWSKEDKYLLVYLPILRVCLGHDSFEKTAYYLRLTGDVYPDITLKFETQFFDIILALGC